MYFWGTYNLDKFTYSIETFLLQIRLGKIGSMKCLNTDFFLKPISLPLVLTLQFRTYQKMFLFLLPDAGQNHFSIVTCVLLFPRLSQQVWVCSTTLHSLLSLSFLFALMILHIDHSAVFAGFSLNNLCSFLKFISFTKGINFSLLM